MFHAGFRFIVALGYKEEMIKEYFMNCFAFNKDISVDLEASKTTIHDGKQHEDWKVNLVDTGLHTQTGGRLKRLKKWLERDECLLFTYGDGVAEIDAQDLFKFHQAHGKFAIVTSVRTPSRFEGQLMGYRHDRFWSCMDTLREKNYLEELWPSSKAPWKM
jgi:glucose-1-phosphate cytidylyltransferase